MNLIYQNFRKNVINDFTVINKMISFLYKYKSIDKSFIEICDSIQIKISFDEILNLDQVKNILYINDEEFSTHDDFDKLIKQAKSFDDLIDVYNRLSWSLWDFANDVPKIVFKNLKIEHNNNYNHKESIIVAIKLFLFYEYKLINNFNCFIGFDSYTSEFVNNDQGFKK
jgi:hypothetical protein